MPVLNDIIKMQKEGISEEDTAQKLREQGYSPAEIKQGLEQARIKSHVEQADENNATESMMQYPSGDRSRDAFQTSETDFSQASEYSGMVPSTLDSQENQAMPEQEAQQQPGQQPSDMTEEYIYPTQPYSEQAYPNYSQFQQPSVSPETITEISEQVSEEKVGKIRDELKKFSNFQIEADKKITDLNERLEKIEKTIERLQFAILGRIGSYVKDVGDIRKEMEMIENSLSKAIVPLAEKAQGKVHEEKKIGRKIKETKSEKHQHSGIG